MQTADDGLLFQTTNQLKASVNHEKKWAAAKDIGSPIGISGKILDFEVLGNEAWTAESGWQARCIDLIVSSFSR